MAAPAERADTTATSLWRQAPVRSGSLGWCSPTKATTARVDSSRQRHQASENSGQTQATATAGIIAVKAQSSGFAPQVNRCHTATDLEVRYPLLSAAVPQIPPVRGPDAAPQPPVTPGQPEEQEEDRPLLPGWQRQAPHGRCWAERRNSSCDLVLWPGSAARQHYSRDRLGVITDN